MRGWLTQGGGGASGLLVVDAESGRSSARANAGTQRPLASNMKLFTTATALSRFGPEYRIATKLFADGPIDADGVLHGSLYLQGGGDPALGTPAFYNGYLGGLGTNLFALKAQLRAAGITAVTGRLYGDDTIFDRLRGVADSGYATSPYIGPLSGLAFNSGFSGPTSSQRLFLRPGQAGGLEAGPRSDRGRDQAPPQVALAATPLDAGGSRSSGPRR